MFIKDVFYIVYKSNVVLDRSIFYTGSLSERGYLFLKKSRPNLCKEVRPAFCIAVVIHLVKRLPELQR